MEKKSLRALTHFGLFVKVFFSPVCFRESSTIVRLTSSGVNENTINISTLSQAKALFYNII